MLLGGRGQVNTLITMATYKNAHSHMAACSNQQQLEFLVSGCQLVLAEDSSCCLGSKTALAITLGDSLGLAWAA